MIYKIHSEANVEGGFRRSEIYSWEARQAVAGGRGPRLNGQDEDVTGPRDTGEIESTEVRY